MPIHPAIFRAYDIRGIANETLTTETVQLLGQALGSTTLDHGDRTLVIARDGRLSSPSLSAALCNGILMTGCDVIDIGLVPTPLLYYATFQLETRSGVMLTGSHNPGNYNGLKMLIAGKTLAEEAIQKLYQRIVANDFHHGQGESIEIDMTDRYIRHITRDVRLARPLKIVVDCGNGAAGFIAPALYRAMGCEVNALYSEIDGHFPNHHPDPSQPENLSDLIRIVRDTKADIGLAFDGDGDRLGVVTTQGDIIWPDRQMMLFAKIILNKHPGASIIYDVKCSNHLEKMIQTHGGTPIMWKTGHSLIKAKLAETRALLAGEMSGHLFFKDRWYGFDDAIYAGARLLEILAETHENSAALFANIPDSINTPELKIYVEENEKGPFMKQLADQSNFEQANISTIDGLRVNFSNGWGLIRPSNTTPCLVLRFEAETQAILEKIQTLFRENLLAVKPDLVIPF